MYLSHICTLEEAAVYLSGKTGDSWAPKAVLDFVLCNAKPASRNPAPIAFAAMPTETVFGRYEFTSPGGMIRKGSARWQLVPLYPIHAAQLVAAGNTFAGLVESPDDDYADGEHYAFIEPLESEHEITLDMVRLKRAAIESIAEQYNAAASSGTPETAEPPMPVLPEKQPITGVDRNRILAHFPPPKGTTPDNWSKTLSDPPRWLIDARMFPGGPSLSALWNPAKFAMAYAEKGYMTMDNLTVIMRLEFRAWLPEWETYAASFD